MKNENNVPMEIKVKEKVSHYDEPGTLLSRLGDFNFTSEFHKINRLGKNAKVWFFVNVGDKQYMGQALSLYTGWKVTVFDNQMGETSMVPVAKFFARDRFELEELMYSLYFELSDLKNSNDKEETENKENID